MACCHSVESVFESFFVQSHTDHVEKRWRQKTLLASEILGSSPCRELRPEVVGDRTRLDLMWFESKLGVRGPNQADLSFQFFPIKNPDTPSAGILKMLDSFERHPLPVAIAQLRFREGFKGELGLWIDSSNESLRDLLHAGTEWLEWTKEQGWSVEVGQKHKQIVHSQDKGWHLDPAVPRCWLPSFDVNNEPIPAESLISLFSQPGPEVNRALFAASFDLLDCFDVPTHLSWCEWGAGYGNLSLGFASRLGVDRAWASEFDKAAAALLSKNAAQFAPGLKTLAQAAEKGSFPEAEFWLIDPPRSGFHELLKGIGEKYPGPGWILAFHCHQQGLISDSTVLKQKAYKLIAFSTVDAFPGTPHFEVISLWRGP